ncbi:MAG TPA: hypothetical protein DCL44_06410 [Elusimicrobia bacterium]|nr:hypothetical protein [Elusimicrobiota bacterium]
MNKKSLMALLAVSMLSAGVCRAGFMEDVAAATGGDFSASLGARSAQFAAAGSDFKVSAPLAVVGTVTRASELYCGGGKLQLTVKDARRFNAVVNDAAITSALRAAAAKFYEGEQRLVNVTFTGPSSFIVADLQKNSDGSGYAAGQFAPQIYLLGGGRARLLLTYFRMNNSYSYDYKEVASFEFSGCNK